MRIVFLSILWLFASVSVSFAQTALPWQVGDTDHLSLLSWSPNDDLILTSNGEENALRLWEVQGGKVRWKNDVGFLQEALELYSIRQAAWTQDQTLVATGSDNGKIQLWDVATGKLHWNIKAHADAVRVLAISPDAKLLVSAADLGDWKSELKVWQVTDGKLIQHLGAKQREIVAMRFLSPHQFQVGNGFGQIITWATESWRTIAQQQIPLCGGVSKRRQVFYHPNFTLMAAQCQKQLIVINPRTGKVTQRIADDNQSAKPLFSPEPTVRYFTDSIDSQIFDAAGKRIEDANGVVMNGGVLNHDGSLLATFPSYHADGVEIFATATWQQQAWLVGHPGIIKALAFSSDGSRFASGSADRIVRIWHTESKQLLASLTGHTAAVESVGFGEDGNTLHSQSEKETIIWNLETNTKIRAIKGAARFEEERRLARSPSGKFALIKESEKPFRLVDVHTNQTLKEFVYIDQLDNLIFCPDEQHFLVKPWWRGWQLWSVTQNEPLREFDVGYSFYNRVAFHPNGNIFITGGEGQNLFMFDLAKEVPLWSLFPIDQQDFVVRQAREARRVAHIKSEAEKARLADIENAKYKGHVYVTFDHYGEMIDPGLQRMAESDRPRKSKIQKPAAEANAVWLRLHNDSPLPIVLPTQSMYFWSSRCAFAFPSGQKVRGLCNNREISVWLGLEDKDGKSLRYGFDFGSSTTLLPQTSVLFAVPRAILVNGQAVHLNVTFQNETAKDKIENFGNLITLKFSAKDLPARQQ